MSMYRIGCTVFLVAPLALLPAASAGAEPTFARDVAPILFEHCASCHRPGDIAPMALLSYEEVRPWARSIRDKVVSREMPPWHAGPDGVAIRNVRALSREAIDTVAAWVDAGAPRGNPGDLPPLPVFTTNEWHHPSGRPPDIILDLPVVMEIPAVGEVPYYNIYSKIPFEEDVFAEAVEMLPGNRSVVHHMSAHVTSLPEGTELRDGVPYLDGRPLTDDAIRAAGARESNVLGAGAAKLICFVPGRGFEMFHDGVAKRVPGGQYLRWSLHYNVTGRPETDHSRIGIWTAKGEVTHEMLSRTIGSPLPTTPDRRLPVIVNGEEVPGREVPPIPPHADDWQILMQTDVAEPITFYAISPHMHLRGKDMRFTLVWPDGREELLLDVPRYDFNWQTEFELMEPLRIPAGSRLIVEGHYDNSRRNRFNPAPHREVYWGEQSWDEMFEGWVKYSIDSQDLSAGATP
ncbi:MAG: hypothetical protein F4Y45_11390 [Acidobacteria bacterium]|nr:hypothetical protein [Acidobacteriota bacterium]MYJ04241.1 hypothetical protein [Acidobacteriota bacterium]